jgi:hypothetical protein
MGILHYSSISPNTSSYYGAYASFVSLSPGNARVLDNSFSGSDENEKSKIHLLRIDGSKTNIVTHMRGNLISVAIVNWTFSLIKQISALADKLY